MVLLGQFLGNKELAHPPTLDIFMRVVGVMCRAGDFEGGVLYTGLAHAHEEGNSMERLGKGVVLIYQVEQLLTSQGVLSRKSGRCERKNGLMDRFTKSS